VRSARSSRRSCSSSPASSSTISSSSSPRSSSARLSAGTPRAAIAADTKPRLSSALQGAIALEVDLSGIEEFDCAGLQLLLATREQARRQDIDLRLLGANAVVRELLALSGLGDALIAPEAN